MISKFPNSVKVLLRFKGRRQYGPGEVIGKEELERCFKLSNLNGLLWNNQVEIIEDTEDTGDELQVTEGVDTSEGNQDQAVKRRGRRKG
jgi:hypothetical protein